jgi:hypothetical protein
MNASCSSAQRDVTVGSHRTFATLRIRSFNNGLGLPRNLGPHHTDAKLRLNIAVVAMRSHAL